MNLAIKTKENELKAMYEKLGKEVYPNLLNQEAGKYKETVKQITCAIELLEQEKTRYCRLNHVKICPKCGHEMAMENIFCVQCGEKVAAPLAENEKQCVQCGKIISSDSRFCTYCGKAQD